MLNENIKLLRKNKGLTQEELASRLHVVRQTISKWEKGLSVPDADTLQKMAEILDTDVSQLLGTEITLEQHDKDVAWQLARINEQLAIKNNRSRKIWKTIGIILLVFFLLNLLFVFMGAVFYVPTSHTSVTVEEVEEEVPADEP